MIKIKVDPGLATQLLITHLRCRKITVDRLCSKHKAIDLDVGLVKEGDADYTLNTDSATTPRDLHALIINDTMVQRIINERTC